MYSINHVLNEALSLSHPQSRDARYFSPKLFFKKIRPSAPKSFEWLDLTCEMICTWLAKRLFLPIPLAVILFSNFGVGLVSANVGEASINGIAPLSFRNADKLQLAFVFEEWVMNADDKGSHFIMRPVDDGHEYSIIDHGHTLIAWRNDLIEPPSLNNHPTILLPVSQYNCYGIQAFGELQPAIKEVQSIPFDVISSIVNDAFQLVCGLAFEDDAFKSFVVTSESHKEKILYILKTRQENLDTIISEKCRRLNLRYETT